MRATDWSGGLFHDGQTPADALAGEPGTGAGPEGARLVRLMRDLAIVQWGDPILTRRDLPPFALPDEADLARAALDALTSKADEIAGRYDFRRRGMGLAAPQIGIPHRACLARSPVEAEQIVLLNPVVTERGRDGPPEFFEGCLSFFGVRGRVPRPAWIVVEHAALDGTTRETRFDGVTARVLMHELDHLDGVLFTQRMPATERLVTVEEYRQL
jgi:peptide deformylase